MLDLEQYQITGSTAREIASSAEAGIRGGRLRSGESLPTVRALAERLATSPATVNAAYRILRERGLVIAEGRRGTRVAPRPPVRAPISSTAAAAGAPAAAGAGEGGRAGARANARAAATTGTGWDSDPRVRDLAIGLPDPALLPPLEPALSRIDLERRLRASGLEAADPELLRVAAAAFDADGVPSTALAVVAGAFDGIERVLQAHLRPGDRVLVEDPAYIGILDLLLALSLVPVPVAVDELGLDPEAFDAALRRGVEAVVIVPRAQNPFGSAMDPERERTLRGILDSHPDVLAIEDDHCGAVAGARFSTLIGARRTRWAIVRSVSKVLHPDLRVALVAGDETTIARVEGRQALGTRWVSHVLQALVVELLADPEFQARTERARDAYASRRLALVEALARHGIEAHGRSGLNVWIPLREEASVVRALDAAGWRVLPGERFRLMTGPGIRVTISTLLEHEAPELARALAEILTAGRPRRLY